jgi:hypothetical protein
MKKTSQKVLAIGLGCLVAAAGAGAIAGSQLFPKTITETIVEQKIVQVPVIEKVVETVEVPVEKEVIVEKTVEVPVEDIDFKQMACDRMLFDDMKECDEEVRAEDAALKKALSFIDLDFNEIAEELEDAGLVDDEDDIELISVFDDYEDIEIVKSNFNNDKYDFKIKIKIDDDEADKKSLVFVTLRVEDGVVEVLKVE